MIFFFVYHGFKNIIQWFSEKQVQFKQQLEIFISPQTPQVRIGNRKVRKVLCAVTFIPKTGNKMQLSSSMHTIPPKRKVTFSSFSQNSIFMKIHWKNEVLISTRKEVRLSQTERNGMVPWLVLVAAGSDVRGRARMEQPERGNDSK